MLGVKKMPPSQFFSGEGSRWNWSGFKVGRLKVTGTVMKHVYAVGSDRWVFHPSFVYDRKEKK